MAERNQETGPGKSQDALQQIIRRIPQVGDRRPLVGDKHRLSSPGLGRPAEDGVATQVSHQPLRMPGQLPEDARRRIAYPGLKAVDEFLTSNMAGRLQVILSTIEPGGGTGEEPYTHDSDEEVVVVLTGMLDLWVSDEHYVLREGDAITFPSRLPHWNMNRSDGPVSVLFCVTPPSF